MFKKITSVLICLSLLLIAVSCTDGGSGNTSSGDVTSVEKSPDAFADGDFKDVSSETPDATVTLSGGTGTISDTARGSSGSEVTITSKGIYRISGSSDGVSINVNDESKSGNVYLVLDNVTMTNDGPCIRVTAGEKVIIQCVGANSLNSTSVDADKSGAIYSKDDLTINGEGSLSLTSATDGIVCKNDLKITGAAINITAGKAGIDANDSVRIGGGSTVIDCAQDGVHIENASGTGYFYMEDGSLALTAGYDGVDAGTSGDSFTGYVKLVGGTLDITAGGGSGNSVNSNTSTKGIKCDGDVYVGDISLNVSSSDDAVNSAGSVFVTAGVTGLSSSDDGIHADSALSISGGELTVSKSYEGLEAYDIKISSGNVSVTASDDGINAAGGSDTTSTETDHWGRFSSSTGTLTVSGGYLYVNSGGDGLDSNGSLYVTGGTVIVEGPTNDGNGPIDRGDGGNYVASITGGTVLAIGSAGMAVNFDDGTQCSALVSISGQAGTVISVDDGSGFTFTASKQFVCAVYSSPSLKQGNSYTLTAGSESATMDFTSGLYYSNVSGFGSGGGRPGR